MGNNQSIKQKSENSWTTAVPLRRLSDVVLDDKLRRRAESGERLLRATSVEASPKDSGGDLLSSRSPHFKRPKSEREGPGESSRQTAKKGAKGADLGRRRSSADTNRATHTFHCPQNIRASGSLDSENKQILTPSCSAIAETSKLNPISSLVTNHINLAGMLDKAVDAPSFKGQFGWEKITDLGILVIVRNTGVRYSPVRVVEQEIIKKYASLPQSVFQCITLKSFYLTALEAKLLNEVNYNHCNQRYGEAYFTVKDVIISATDAKELSRYLNICLEAYSYGIARLKPRLGVIEVMTDPTNDPSSIMLLPFTTKVRNDGIARFVPYRVVEHFVRITSSSIFSPPNDWDIMYLKMLSAYSNQDQIHQLITKDSQLVLLDGLMYKSSNTPLSYLDWTGAPPTQDMNNIR